MPLLAIETSCDETCAAVFEEGRLLSNVVASQEIHRKYGGVVPELASRAHLQHIAIVVKDALIQAGVEPRQLSAVAATYGPGLVGSLLVGLNFAKGMALDLNIPLIAINHLEGHLFSNNIGPEGPEPPFLSLILSGGHSILTYVQDWGQYEILGETQDDAAGEAFDKVARVLGLPYPGGPQIEKIARQGNPDAIAFPMAKLKDAPFDFSFSGLKTAVLYRAQKDLKPDSGDSREAVAHIAASFQKALIGAIVRTASRAHKRFPVNSLSLAGGVACNKPLRQALSELGDELGFQVFFPDPIYCTDNAAMIGRAAWHYLATVPHLSDRDAAISITAQPGLRLSNTKMT